MTPQTSHAVSLSSRSRFLKIIEPPEITILNNANRNMNDHPSAHAIIHFRFPEKVFASVLDDQSELFEFEIRALDLAFVD